MREGRTVEEPGDAEEDGFGVRQAFLEPAQREPLAEHGHGKLIAGIAERVRESLPPCLVLTVHGSDAHPASGLAVHAETRGVFHEGEPVIGRKLPNGRQTTARTGGRDRNGPGRHGTWIEAHLRDFAVRGRPGEAGAASAREEIEMQDDILVGRIASMAVAFPVGGVEIEFNAALTEHAVDLDRTVAEVGPCSMVPPAELDDADRLTVSGDEVAAEVACEPAALPCEFRAGPDTGGFGEQIGTLAQPGGGEAGLAAIRVALRRGGHGCSRSCFK